MGQYYKLINEDKQESIDPPMLKMWEIMNNPTAGALAYLTADAPYDGGGTPTANYRAFKDEDGNVDWDECGRMCSVTWPNFGRWSGDRIRTVGDYAESGLYGEAERSVDWTNVTDEVLPEVRAAEDDTMGRGGVRIGTFGRIGSQADYKVFISRNDPTKFYGVLHPGNDKREVETELHDTPRDATIAAKGIYENNPVGVKQ